MFITSLHRLCPPEFIFPLNPILSRLSYFLSNVLRPQFFFLDEKKLTVTVLYLQGNGDIGTKGMTHWFSARLS